jgi:hypothetical protein
MLLEQLSEPEVRPAKGQSGLELFCFRFMIITPAD